MANSMLCGYHGLTSFPPPVLLFFDRTRERRGEGDKAFRRITIPANVRPRQFMRGLFLNLVGKLEDPYEEWEKWDTNGAVVHVSPAHDPDWESRHASAVVVLFTPVSARASTEQLEQQQLQQQALADASVALAASGVSFVAVNCRIHDEVCVDTFRPNSLPAVYYKKAGDTWQGFRGEIATDALLQWVGVDAAARFHAEQVDLRRAQKQQEQQVGAEPTVGGDVALEVGAQHEL
jgi:hypothetical protein